MQQMDLRFANPGAFASVACSTQGSKAVDSRHFAFDGPGGAEKTDGGCQ